MCDNEKIKWPEKGKHWPGENVGPEYCPKRAKRQAQELMDCWVKNIEEDCDLKKNDPDVCAGCFPEFTCLASIRHKKPFCHKFHEAPLITNIQTKETRYVSERKNVTESNPRVENILVGYNVEERPIPVWERPRIHSKLFVGGRWRSLHDCYKKNGLSDEWCPRTKSCQLYKSMYDWIQRDFKERGQYIPPEQLECCCCPGDKEKLPYVTCVTCEPAKPHAVGYVGYDVPVRPPPDKKRRCDQVQKQEQEYGQSQRHGQGYGQGQGQGQGYGQGQGQGHGQGQGQGFTQGRALGQEPGNRHGYGRIEGLNYGHASGFEQKRTVEKPKIVGPQTWSNCFGKEVRLSNEIWPDEGDTFLLDR